MHVINTFEAPTLYNEAGEPIIASRGFKVVKFADYEAERERLVGMLREYQQKLEKVVAWLEMNAQNDENAAKTCRFESLNKAYRDDAANYRATAADIRKLLAKTAALAKDNHHE